MINLENFIQGANMNISMTGKKAIFSSYNGNKIKNILDGTVLEIDENKQNCKGHIKIQHEIDNQKVISNICGVGKILVSQGNSLRKNEVIGLVGDSTIEYTMKDSQGESLKFDDFLTPKPDTDKTKKSKDDKEKNKEDDKEKNKEKEKNKKKPKEIEKPTGLYNAVRRASLLPFSFIHKVLGGKSDKKLNEEIDRIRQLLK